MKISTPLNSSALIISCILAMIAVFAPLSADAAFDPIPEDDNFVPFYCGDQPAWDPYRDADGGTNHRDPIGDDQRPAALRTATDTHLYLRMRLDGDPRQGNRLKSFGWGYLFDAPPLNFDDGDAGTNTYDYLLHLEGGGSHDGRLRFYSNEGQLVMDDPTAPAAGDLLWEYEHTAADPLWHVKETGDTPFAGDTDYWLTIAIPWTDLEPHDITPDGVAVLWMGTSNSNQAINVDFICHDDETSSSLTLSEFGSDPAPLDPYSDHCASGIDSCDENAECTNIVGGTYSCECNDGYSGDGYECDPQAPDLVVLSPTDNQTIDDDLITVEGTSDPGDEIDVYIDGVFAGSTTADANGDWSLDVILEENGETEITVTATNDHDHSTTIIIDVFVDIDQCETGTHSCHADATCTNISGGGYTCQCDPGFTGNGENCEPGDVSLSVTSPSQGDTLEDHSFTITGSSDPGAEIDVYIDGQFVGTTTTDGNGDWSLDVAVAENGDYEISVTATDEFNNTSTVVFDVIVDVDQCQAGSHSCHADAVCINIPGGGYTCECDDGFDGDGQQCQAIFPDLVVTSPSEGDTIDSDTFVVEGTADPGDVVEVFVDGQSVGFVVADENGDWSFEVEVDENDEYTITVIATNEYDNSSTVEFDITVDFDHCQAQLDACSDDSTCVNVPGGTFTCDCDPGFKGDYCDDLVLTLIVDSPTDGAHLANSTPTVTGTSTPGATIEVLIDGQLAGTTEADENGDWSYTHNQSLDDGLYDLSVVADDGDETLQEDSTFIIDTEAPQVTIDTPGEDDILDESPSEISGQTEPNTTVIVYLDGEEVGQTTSDEDGNWSLELDEDLDDGEYTITVEAIDEAGNIGVAEQDFLIDSTAPVTITSPQEGSQVRSGTPVIEGTAQPGATVVIVVDGDEVDTVEADDQGNWTWSPDEPFDDGDVTITAESTSEQGVTTTDTVNFTVDTTVTGVTIDTEDGTLTNDDTPTITGTAEPGSEVDIIVDGEVVDTVEADENGNWTWTPEEPFDDGDHVITARPSGGDNADGETITITVDTIPPDLDVNEPVDNGDGTVTIGGTTEPGATIDVYVDGDLVGTTTADEDGNWSVDIDVDEESEYDVEIVAGDPAGNISTVDIVIHTDGSGDLDGHDEDDPRVHYFVSGGGFACSASHTLPTGGFLIVVVFGLGLMVIRRRR